jgi:hypothetical protein
MCQENLPTEREITSIVDLVWRFKIPRVRHLWLKWCEREGRRAGSGASVHTDTRKLFCERLNVKRPSRLQIFW